MNLKAVELYEQALDYAYKNVCREDWGSNNFQAVAAGRLAELVVLQCAHLVKDFYQEDEFTCLSAAQELKDYFGVE